MKHSLILLFGMPRSGTTWIAKIFDSHPNTLYRHEPDSGGALKPIPLIAPVADAERYQAIIAKFAERLPQIRTLRAAGSLPLFPKQYQSSAHLLLKRFSVLATKASEAFVRDVPIPEFIDYEKVRNLHVVWKSIESLGRLGIILRAVPQSRAFVLLRHPCGYIASVLAGEGNNQFSSSTASSDDYPVYEMLLTASRRKERNPDLDDLKNMQPVERLAWRWVLYNEIALADTAGLKNCISVRYESLCAQPVVEAKKLIQLSGLQWHSQVEAFVQGSTARSSDHYYSVFKDPAASSTKWQTQLSPDQIKRIMSIVRKSCFGERYADNCSREQLRYA
jgi:hypothetical protein